MNKLLPQNWNDTVSLLLIILIPAIWVLNGRDKITVSPEVSGALIATWTMVVQFYFRKAPTEK